MRFRLSHVPNNTENGSWTLFGARHESDARRFSSSSPFVFHYFVLDAELVGLFTASSIIHTGTVCDINSKVCVMQFAVRCVPLLQSKVTHARVAMVQVIARSLVWLSQVA